MPDPMDNPDWSAELIGYHLGLSDEADRARVTAALGDAAALRSACARVEQVLSPLAADAVDPPSGDLVQGVLHRVAGINKTLPLKPQAAKMSTGADEDVRTGGPLLRARELVSLAAAILLFVGIFVPGYRTARSSAQRTACMNNLRLLGNGYGRYAESYGGHMPFAGMVPEGASWLPADTAEGPRFSNRRHVFGLVSGRFVPARAFIDPARSGDVALTGLGREELDDFPDPRNISYSTEFVTGPRVWHASWPNMPLAADLTPLVDASRRLNRNAAPGANSPSHGRPGGQNVLRANLSVRWFAQPDVGVDHDDIYRLVGVQRYTGLERPRLRTDAFLIP